MNTHIIVLNRRLLQDRDMMPAAQAITRGGTVVFPTETVYGLGCRYDDPQASDKIFALKARERSKPLAIYLLAAPEIEKFALMTPRAVKLAEKFLPGPLTLIRLSGVPLAGTSANLSGRQSPTDGQQAVAAMNGRVDVIIDAGKTPLQCPSTVVDLTADPPLALREGAIPIGQLAEVLSCTVRKGFP